ncbi:MAG: AEC family transporter [Alphaproteobacteria bacterium]
MVQILLSIAPVFILIILGNLLRRYGIPGTEFWDLNDRLVYWVLIPSLLFHKTSTLSLSGALVGPYAVVILGGFAAAILFALAVGRGLSMAGPVASSVLQGAARHNTFIALAVAERLLGGEGLALAALATSLLIPVANVAVVVCMVMLTSPSRSGGIAAALARDLARNPLIVSVLLGVSVNLIDVGEIPVVHDVADILGRAALPIVLLCVGANIRVVEMRAAIVPFLASTAGKLLVFPAAIAALATAIGLHGSAAIVAIVYGSVPTASSAYTLARRMGGDAPLMASIITLQTLIAFLTMPLTIVAAQRAFS